MSLTPGVQIQSSTASFACESLIVGGGSNRSGNFSVDGGGNNDDYLGSSCGSQVRPALESVQEFQVLTNQCDAEFGRTAGAIVNAITKQGTNVVHGSRVRELHERHGHRGGLLRPDEQPGQAADVSDRLGRHASAVRWSRTRRISSTASIASCMPRDAATPSTPGRS